MNPEVREATTDPAYLVDTRMEFARRQAEDRGCVIEVADDYTLQLDIDNDADFDRFMNNYALLGRLNIPEVWCNGWTVRRSRSGNRHVTVSLVGPVPVLTRILLQAVLGSDRVREMLAFSRVLKGEEHPVILFRPKEG